MQGLARGASARGWGNARITGGDDGAWDGPPGGERKLDDVCGPADGPRGGGQMTAVRFPGIPAGQLCAALATQGGEGGHHDEIVNGPAAQLRPATVGWRRTGPAS